MEKYDAIIIGFGKGGKVLAGALADNNQKVALVEKSKKMYGGTCINAGCIPSKYLVHSSETASLFKGSFEEKAEMYKTAVLEKKNIVSKLRQKNYDKLASNPNITIIDGFASFSSPNTISIDGKYDIEGKRIFVDTGSRPFIPEIDGLKESNIVYTSETLLDLEILPKNLVIIGGGYIGLEFAAIYSNFGSKVTIIQDGKKFLPKEDEEISQCILNVLENKGINVILGAKTEKITNSGVLILTENSKKEIEADAVLIATGRIPNTDNLNVAAAGIELSPNSGIKTDEYLKTTADNIWAIGDAAGGMQFTYISLDDYRIIKSQILGNSERNTNNRGVVPYSVFITPPFSRAGMSEKEALEKGFDIKVAKITPASHPKAIILKETNGLLKAIIDKKTGEILGVHLFCAESPEMINLFKLAMDNKIPYTVLRDNIYNHPVMTEIINDFLQ